MIHQCLLDLTDLFVNRARARAIGIVLSSENRCAESEEMRERRTDLDFNIDSVLNLDCHWVYWKFE